MGGILLPGQHRPLARALAEFGMPAVREFFAELRKAKGTHFEWTLDHSASYMLSTVEDASTARYLAESYGDFSPMVNIGITDALRSIEIRNPGTLLELLKDPEAKVRKRAAFVLGTIWFQNDDVENALIEALNDENPEVRETVEKALDKRERKNQGEW